MYKKFKELFNTLGEKIMWVDWLTEGCRINILKEMSVQRNAEELQIEAVKESFKRWIHWIGFDGVVQKVENVQYALDAAKKISMAESLPEMVGVLEEYVQLLLNAIECQKANADVGRAMAFVQEHYTEKSINLSVVAAEVGISKEYLCSLMRRNIGIGLPEYINNLRICRAKELLDTTNMKNYEIAEEVGFQDESYFSRVFKKVVGIRPNEYKRVAKQKSDDEIM